MWPVRSWAGVAGCREASTQVEQVEQPSLSQGPLECTSVFCFPCLRVLVCPCLCLSLLSLLAFLAKPRNSGRSAKRVGRQAASL